MGGWDCRESLHNLVDTTMEASLSLEEAIQGQDAPKLRESLEAITWELWSWGFDDVRAFGKPVCVPLLCREVLAEMYPAGAWELRAGMSVADVYGAIYPEYHNLLKILSGRADADLRQAKAFCIALTQVGLAQWQSPRRGLAA